jgi:hypothetical protein
MGRGRAVCVAVIAASIALSSPKVRAEKVSVPEAGWTDAGVKDGVALSYREHPELHARELRAIAEVPVPARLMFAAVCDFPRYREFVPGIVESTEVERSGPNDYIAYVRYAPRFLVVAARDVVLHVSIDEEERTGAWRCGWSQVPGRVPERPRAVRMPLNLGTYTVEPLNEKLSRITYRATVKPGGSLPDWLVRWGAARALPEMINVMQKRAGTLAKGPDAATGSSGSGVR